MEAENFPQRYYRWDSGTTAAGFPTVPRLEEFQPQRYHPWRYRYQQAAVQPPGQRYYRWTSINKIEEHPAVLPRWYRGGTVSDTESKTFPAVPLTVPPAVLPLPEGNGRCRGTTARGQYRGASAVPFQKERYYRCTSGTTARACFALSP